MKKRSSTSCIFVLIIILLVNINCLAASNRGLMLTVKTPKGNLIDLYRDSYALIVGNSNYSNGWDPIPGAIRDVNEVAKALEKHGFNIILKTDLTKDEFNKAINEFSLKYGNAEDNRLLFYYAGHGFTRKMATGEELGYLVMVDAPLPVKDIIGFSINSVDMQALIIQAKIIKARHVLFMFDSCFSGSIINMRESVVPKSISDNVLYPVRQFITAGRANEPVPDNSVFKQAFLDLLEGRADEPIPDGYITGEELGLYLKTKVPQYNPSQHPQYGKIRDPRLDKGDFVFVISKSSSAIIEKPIKEYINSTISIEVNIPTATVFVDEKEIGKTPIYNIEIIPGEHMVKVEKNGYETYKKSIVFKQGQSVALHVFLSKKMTPIESEPGTPIANINVDGNPSDWDNITADMNDPQGDSLAPQHLGSDLIKGYVATNPARNRLFFRFDVEGSPNTETSPVNPGSPLIQYCIAFDDPSIKSWGAWKYDWQIGIDSNNYAWIWDLRGDKDYDDISNLTIYPSSNNPYTSFAQDQVIEFSIPISLLNNIETFWVHPYLVLRDSANTNSDHSDYDVKINFPID